MYRVTAARLRDATVPAVRYRLRYADGPHDAEALLVDPRGNRLYVATKGLTGGGLYRARPGRPATGSTCSSGWPGARRSPTGPSPRRGRGFVLRDYQGAFVYPPPGRRVAAFDLPLQLQGESITMSADGRSVLAGSGAPTARSGGSPSPSRSWPGSLPPTRAPPAAAPGGRPAPAGGSRWGAAPSWS